MYPKGKDFPTWDDYLMALANRHYHHRLALLLFAAPKLPAMARSLGQSMRIIRSEVKEMKNDGKPRRPRTPRVRTPLKARVVDHPEANRAARRD